MLKNIHCVALILVSVKLVARWIKRQSSGSGLRAQQLLDQRGQRHKVKFVRTEQSFSERLPTAAFLTNLKLIFLAFLCRA